MNAAGSAASFLAGALILVLGGCSSTASLDEFAGAGYRSRAVEQRADGLRISTSVLSAAESRAIYGVPLSEAGIQPVWIEVENRDDVAYWLLSPGLDPQFFAASEAAELFADHGAGDVTARRFAELSFRNPISPGTVASGFVLTNLDEGVKITQVDLVASGRLRTFSTLNAVPGFRADFQSRRSFRKPHYVAQDIVDYQDQNTFRAALEALPCCVTNEDGTRNGDPLNLVVVGGVDDAFPALVRRGWRLTEETWWGSVMKMATSALSGERYRYAPISPLYLYGRPQDIALQRARDNIHQRNHLRLWRSPMRYRGKAVWVGQISRDIGSRLTIHSPYLTTHKIDPDVDEARTALSEDMAYSQNLAAFGMVEGVGAAPRDAPRGNLTTDPYYTDGYRAVLIFDSKPNSLASIEFLPWAGRRGGFVEQLQQEAGQ